MHYVQCRKLDINKLRKIRQLEETCAAADNRLKPIEIVKNYRNLYAGADCFFLCYQSDRLVGFLQLFFPDEEAELTVLVDPAFRQKGIFKNLLAMAAAELELFYVSVLRCYPPFAGDEQNRRAGTIQALQKTGWTLESTELVMRFDMYNKLSSVKEDTSLVLTLSQRKHIQAISELEAELFGKGEEGKMLFQEELQKEAAVCYVLLLDSKVIGACCIHEGDRQDFLFGVVLDEKRRGKGLGSYMLSELLKIRKTCKKPICLQVSEQNTSAVALYKKFGFNVVQQQEVYLFTRLRSYH